MSKALTYEIQVEGGIGERWLAWFEDMNVTAREEAQGTITTLNGPITDQAALLGLLERLYTLGLPLLLVRRI